MSKTPRTDALLLEINEGRVYKDEGPLVDLCRSLETELREKDKRIEIWELKLADMENHNKAQGVLITRYRERIAELEEALKDISNKGCFRDVAIADEALSKTTNPDEG